MKQRGFERKRSWPSQGYIKVSPEMTKENNAVIDSVPARTRIKHILNTSLEECFHISGNRSKVNSLCRRHQGVYGKKRYRSIHS